MHTDLSGTSRRAQRVILGVAAVLSWLLSMAFSLVASPDYTIPVSLALAFRWQSAGLQLKRDPAMRKN